METPSVPALLEAWEHGQQRTAAHRGLLLLQAAFSDVAPGDLATIPIGRRNRLLLGLRGRLFGFELEGLAACTACGETLETRLPVDPDAGVLGAGEEVLVLSRGGHDVRYRLPTTSDMLALPSGDADEVARWLLLRCIVGARRDGAELPPAALPADVTEEVAAALAENDPDAVVELVATCPHCCETTVVPLDPAAYLWAEVDQWAWRVLADVRDLATAYGWSEADILAMSPWRRQAYLELLPA